MYITLGKQGRARGHSQGNATVSGRSSFDFIQDVLLEDHLISIRGLLILFRQSRVTAHVCT